MTYFVSRGNGKLNYNLINYYCKLLLRQQMQPVIKCNVWGNVRFPIGHGVCASLSGENSAAESGNVSVHVTIVVSKPIL